MAAFPSMTATRWTSTPATVWDRYGAAHPMWKAGSAKAAAVKRKSLDWRRVKIHRTYDAADISRDFGVSRNTVWNLRKAGLRPIAGIKPMLFLGAELRRFLIERRAKR